MKKRTPKTSGGTRKTIFLDDRSIVALKELAQLEHRTESNMLQKLVLDEAKRKQLEPEAA